MNTESTTNAEAQIERDHCPNCKAALYGQFCFSCGQNQKAIDRHFFTLVNEFLEDVFTPNSRTARTLFYLSFRPGFLTREYFSGRKARYIQPIRLYLTMSIIFFFLASLISSSLIDTPDGNTTRISIGDEESIEVDVDWPFISEQQSKTFNERLKTQVIKANNLFREDPGAMRDMVIDNAPPVIFCLVPLFALLLKLTYFNKGRYYTEHLVLALHNHSFLFTALLLESLIGLFVSGAVKDTIEMPIDIWIPVYLFLSLKVTYGDGWLGTAFKFVFLGICYWSLFMMIAFSAALIGVMSL